jgi:hypothetical protein
MQHRKLGDQGLDVAPSGSQPLPRIDDADLVKAG